MDEKLNKKGFNECKIVIPMSDETIKNIKANATKIVLGASIAGFMMFGGQSAKSESVHEPQAIIQTAETQNEAEKKELYLEIDKLMSFNKAARVENDEQKFAKRKIQNANTASVDLEENLHQSSVRDEASADTVIETTSIAEKGAEKNIEEKVQTDEAKETITEDKTVETSEVQSEEEKNHPEEAGQTEKNGEKSELSLDEFINNKGIDDLFDVDKISEAEEKPEVTEEKTPDAQKAPEASTEPNYTDDEKKIKCVIIEFVCWYSGI